MGTYDNPNDRDTVFVVPEVETNQLGLIKVTSAFEVFLALAQMITTSVPSGFLLVSQPESDIPAGVYRKNSIWTTTEIHPDGEFQTIKRYKVRPVTDLAGSSGSATYDGKIYDLAKRFEEYFADMGITMGITQFGYFKLSSTEVGRIPSEDNPTALELAIAEGRHVDDATFGGKGPGTKTNVLPWILGGLGFLVGGPVGAPIGFVLGSTLGGKKDKKPEPSPVTDSPSYNEEEIVFSSESGFVIAPQVP